MSQICDVGMVIGGKISEGQFDDLTPGFSLMQEYFTPEGQKRDAGVRAIGALAGEADRQASCCDGRLSLGASSVRRCAVASGLGGEGTERRGRGLVQTEAGQIALDHAEAIFRTADDLTATLRQTGQTRHQQRVGALATLSRNFQMQFVRHLIGRPDVEVVLRSGSQTELLRDLDALALDVVLTNLAPSREAGSPWLVHQLAAQPVSLIGTPAPSQLVKAFAVALFAFLDRGCH